MIVRNERRNEKGVKNSKRINQYDVEDKIFTNKNYEGFF